MKLSLIALLTALLATPFANLCMAEVKTQTIEYKAGDVTMMGYLAYDDAKVTEGKTAPGVLVFPEWWGLTDYPKKRAQMLAELGYVAFAVDMYGVGKTTDDPKQAGAWATEVKSNPELERLRFEAALKTFENQPQVDKSKLGGIGYCFGGSMVLDMARVGEPLIAVASFHGDLTTRMPRPDKAKAKLLVCTGGADPMVGPDTINDFMKDMNAVGAWLKLIVYPGAKHAFTNPDADSHHIDGIAYNKDADTQSWEEMKAFFANAFGDNQPK